MFSSLFSRLPLSLSSASGSKNGNKEGDETGSGRSLSLPWPVTEAAGSSSNGVNRPKKEGSIIWSHQGQGANGVTISNPIPRMTTNTLADFDDYSSHHSPRTPNMKGPNSASIASAGSVKSSRAPFSSGLIQSSMEDKGQRGRPQRMGSYSQAPMLHTPVLQNTMTQSSAPLQTPQQTPIQYGQAISSSAPNTPFYSYAPPEVVRVESGTDSEDTTRKVAGSPEMLPHQVPPDILRPSSSLGEYVPLTRKTQPQPITEQPSPETSHALYSYPYPLYGDGMNLARESNADFYNGSPVDDDDDKEIPEVFHFPPKSVSSSSSSSGQTATATKATFRQGLKLYVPPYAQSTHSSHSENSVLHSTSAFPLPPSHLPNFATGQSLGQNQAFPVDVATAQQIQIHTPISSAEAEAYYQGMSTDVYGSSYNYPLAKQLSPIQEQDYVSPASAAASVSMASSRFKFKIPGFMNVNGSQESVLPSAAAGRHIGAPGVAEGDDKGSTRTQRTGSIGSVANSLKGPQLGMNLSRAGSLSVLKEGLEAAAEGGSTGSAGDREPTGPVIGRGLFITRQLKRTVSQTSSRSDGQNQPTTPHNNSANRLSGATSLRDFSSPRTPTPTFHTNPNASVSMIISPTSTIATTGTTNVSMHTPASTFIHSPGTVSPVPGQTPISAVNTAVAAAAGPTGGIGSNAGVTPAGAGTTTPQRPAPVITITPMPQYQTQGTGNAGGGGLLKLPSLPNITPIDLRFSSFLGRDRGNQAAGVAYGQAPAYEHGYDVDGIEEGEEYDDEGDYVVDDDGDYYEEGHGDYDQESLHAESYTASMKDVDGKRRKSNNGKERQMDADEDDLELDTLDKNQNRVSSESAEPPPAPLSPLPPKSLKSFKSGEHRLRTGESFIHRRWERDVPMGVTASPTLFRTRSPSRWFFKKANGISNRTPAFWSFWFGFLFPVLWLIAGWHFTNAGEMPPKVTMWEWYFLRGSRWWLQGVTGRLRTVFGCCLPRRPASQRSSGTAEGPHLHQLPGPGNVTLRQGMARKKMSAAQSQARIGKVYPALPRWVAEKQSTDDGRMRLNDPKRSLRGISFGYPFIPRPLGSHGSYTGMDPSDLGSHSLLGRMVQRLLRIVTSPNRVLDQLYGVKLREVRGRPESGRRMFDPWIQRSRYAFCYALITLAIAMCVGSAYLIVVNTRRL